MAAGERVQGHRPGLDGLRGFAVAVVVAYHLGYLSGGFLGVDVFFVLSGYLITGLALAEVERSGGLSLRGFWGRRARRLIPALLVVVTVALAVALALGWPHDQLHELAWNTASTLTWWANWRQAHGASYWANGENLFRHAWSLSIEEQFYVLWPLVFVASAAVAAKVRRRPALVVGTVAAAGALASAAWQVVLAHRLGDGDLSRVYVGTDTRAVAPLAGCALACVLAGRPRPSRPGAAMRAATYVAGGLLLWLIATVEVSAPDLYRHGWLVVATAAAGVLVWSAGAAETGDRDPYAWAITTRVSRYLGSRSYGLYLWSWPTQVLLRFRWPGLSKLELAAITVAASLALAEVSFRAVEQPIRRRVGWAAQPRARRPAWAAGVVAAVAVLAMAVALEEPIPLHERVDTQESAQGALHRPPTTAPEASVAPGEPQPLRVMVTGDSVAWTVGYYKPDTDQLPPGIASIDSRALIGCGMLAAEGWKYPQGDEHGVYVLPGGGACAQQAEAERIGLSAHPDVVLLFPGAWEWASARSPDGTVVPAQSERMAAVLHRRLLRRILAAKAVGARFVLVAWSCPGSKAAGVRKEPDYIRWINGVMADAAADAKRHHGAEVSVLQPTDQVCVDGDPTGEPTPGKVQATGDEVHVVDDAGGRWIWDTWLGPALAPA